MNFRKLTRQQKIALAFALLALLLLLHEVGVLRF